MLTASRTAATLPVMLIFFPPYRWTTMAAQSRCPLEQA